MKPSYSSVTLLALALLAGACGSSEPENGVASLRLMHARTGAPAVDLLVDGDTVFQGVGFAQASAFAEVPAGSATVDIRSGDTDFASAPANFAPGARYTLLFSNSGGTSDILVAEDTATGVPLEPPPIQPGDTGAIPGESKVKLRVIHNASDAPPLDVYLTLNDEPLDGAIRLLEPFVYGVGLSPEFPGYVERDPGIWRVRFTDDNTLDVVLDTGPISMSAGQVRSVILFSSDTTGMGIAIVRER